LLDAEDNCCCVFNQQEWTATMCDECRTSGSDRQCGSYRSGRQGNGRRSFSWDCCCGCSCHLKLQKNAPLPLNFFILGPRSMGREVVRMSDLASFLFLLEFGQEPREFCIPMTQGGNGIGCVFEQGHCMINANVGGIISFFCVASLRRHGLGFSISESSPFYSRYTPLSFAYVY
jgi:hypothetical protein